MNGITINDNLDLNVSVKRDSGGLILVGILIDDVTNQNIESIIRLDKGEIKEDPTKCVGIRNYLDDESEEMSLRLIRTELARDGMSLKNISFNNGNILIDAVYENK